MKWQQFVKDYLFFSKKERNAIIILITVIVIIAMIPYLYKPNIAATLPTAEQQVFLQELAKLKEKENKLSAIRNNEEETQTSGQYSNGPKAVLFYFDPNTLSVEGWQKLGVRDRTIQTIKKYLSKGGKFKEADDLKKIYGLRENETGRLMTYVRIARKIESGTKSFQDIESPAQEQYVKKAFRHQSINVNTADEAVWVALPGVGEKLAARIIGFREKLGGFHNIDQIGETYGLPDSTFQKIRPRLSIEDGQVRRLNINTATLEELKQHPYIRWNIARVLVAYRGQHGNFTSIEEIRQIDIITPEIFQKIAPYLSIE